MDVGPATRPAAGRDRGGGGRSPPPSLSQDAPGAGLLSARGELCPTGVRCCGRLSPRPPHPSASASSLRPVFRRERGVRPCNASLDSVRSLSAGAKPPVARRGPPPASSLQGVLSAPRLHAVHSITAAHACRSTRRVPGTVLVSETSERARPSFFPLGVSPVWTRRWTDT